MDELEGKIELDKTEDEQTADSLVAVKEENIG